MAFQNALFWFVGKRSVKTHIRTVVRIFRIWTGVPDVVYLAGSFKLYSGFLRCFTLANLCVIQDKNTDKNFKQPNCFWLSMHAYHILLPSETDDSRFICAKSICSQTQFSHIINRLLPSLVRSVLWNIRPLFFAWASLLRRSVHTKKPRSDISQYRPHAPLISVYYNISLSLHSWDTSVCLICKWSKSTTS